MKKKRERNEEKIARVCEVGHSMWTSGRKGSSWIVVQRLHTDIFGGHDGRRLLLNHLLLLLSSFAFLTHFEVFCTTRPTAIYSFENDVRLVRDRGTTLVFVMALIALLVVGLIVNHPENLECGTDATTRLKLGARIMQGQVCVAFVWWTDYRRSHLSLNLCFSCNSI